MSSTPDVKWEQERDRNLIRSSQLLWFSKSISHSITNNEEVGSELREGGTVSFNLSSGCFSAKAEDGRVLGEPIRSEMLKICPDATALAVQPNSDKIDLNLTQDTRENLSQTRSRGISR
jgi:hypothetical protein